MGVYEVSKNLLIVESENDQYFIELLKTYLNNNSNANIDANIDNPICIDDDDDDYECLNGLSEKALKLKLTTLKPQIEKNGIEKIGIIIDADQEGITQRVELINIALKVIDDNLQTLSYKHFIKSERLDVEIACYIMNIDGYGELETVLKTISKDSPFADCLDDWRTCLEKKNKKIKDKDFLKFWVSIYQRFDACSKKERTRASTKCNPEASFKKPDIWNLEHPVLDKLKFFLRLF